MFEGLIQQFSNGRTSGGVVGALFGKGLDNKRQFSALFVRDLFNKRRLPLVRNSIYFSQNLFLVGIGGRRGNADNLVNQRVQNLAKRRFFADILERRVCLERKEGGRCLGEKIFPKILCVITVIMYIEIGFGENLAHIIEQREFFI